jgi:hypothetical protein
MPVDNSQRLPFSGTFWTVHLNIPLLDAHNQANWNTSHNCILFLQRSSWTFPRALPACTLESCRLQSYLRMLHFPEPHTWNSDDVGIAEFQKYDEANLLKKALKSELLLYARIQRQSSQKQRQILSSGAPQLTEWARTVGHPAPHRRYQTDESSGTTENFLNENDKPSLSTTNLCED